MNNVASALANGALLSAFLTAAVWLVLRRVPPCVSETFDFSRARRLRA